MGIVDFALAHAREGRLVFPGCPNSKQPAISSPYEAATTDEATIIAWWQQDPNRNICLPGGYEISPGKYLGFIDIDVKNANGLKTIEEFDILGFEFPETLAQTTPSGGLHFFYYFDFPIRNSAGSLGPGIDTRGFHGYVLGAGSGIDGKGYRFKNREVVQRAPDWLQSRLRKVGTEIKAPLGNQLHLVHDYDQGLAERRASEFLKNQTPATQGERNGRAFQAAARLKDFGLKPARTFELMATEWKAEPPLEPEELGAAVKSAFVYGQNTPGLDAPEAAFEPLPPEPKKPKHPVDQLNDEYAFLTAGGGCRILWETKGAEGEDRVEHLSLQSFHDKLSNRRITVGEKQIPVSKMWMTSPARREYDGIIFKPNYDNKKFFNVWRGFAVGMPTEPPKIEAINSLEFFLEHIKENVCNGDEGHTRWVLGFFAHMIQFPEKKPRVALALRGKKGVGKNVLTTCIGRLLGTHYLLAANRRYLSGNFNSHLENKILLVLDEAYWSGDKASEGILKDLVTGSTHQIERKGYEPYTVANLTRVVIFGNEEWIVPASEDERRYAVFEMGDKRKEDDEYFGVILDGMRDHGGDKLLFKYLMEFDLKTVDINKAPRTDALINQKEETLDPFKYWWLSCLKLGALCGDNWPTEVPCGNFMDAFLKATEAQNIRSRLPGANWIGRTLKKILPSLQGTQLKRDGQLVYRIYDMPTLEQARADWEQFIGGKVNWEMLDF